mmetsp:Transcript_15388/g.26005  ORF Transcript_15388/g.26005 Transcript_15388/m.26005 type:complete len:91 (-) Transcript_15388:361-633(-)
MVIRSRPQPFIHGNPDLLTTGTTTTTQKSDWNKKLDNRQTVSGQHKNDETHDVEKTTETYEGNLFDLLFGKGDKKEMDLQNLLFSNFNQR